MPNPFAPPSRAGSSAKVGSGRAALDKLIRRELKVGDPNDASEVAQALMKLYRDDPRARAMAQEAQGFPYSAAQPPSPAPVAQEGATALDLAQAKADVDQDLRELTTTNLAKDIVPELEGWAQAIRSAIEQGVSMARQGMDTGHRDIAFAMRRQLGDYARAARILGALTPPLNPVYRNLAQSLDEVSAVILVMMGEALANTGMAGGRYLLQTPYSELQTRREVVLNALRNLAGTTQEALAPNEWPRGIDAYRQLFKMFEAQGHGELRALLTENELARNMDELIQAAGSGEATGLRALGATAWGQLTRFTRFVQLTMSAIAQASPPLLAFQEALEVFVDGFAPAGGFRLLRVARPPALFYGLYGSDQISLADRRLVQLVINRVTLAGRLDCTAFSRSALPIGAQVLYDIDRAIDLYCIGADDLGIPEARASAYGFVLDAVLGPKKLANLSCLLTETMNLLRPPLAATPQSLWDTTRDAYDALRERGADRTGDWSFWNASLLVQEIRMQQQADQQLRNTIGQMTTNRALLDKFFKELDDISDQAAESAAGTTVRPVFPRTTPTVPRDFEEVFDNNAKAFDRARNVAQSQSLQPDPTRGGGPPGRGDSAVQS